MIFKRASIFELSEFLKRTWQLRIWRSGGATPSRWMMLLEARVMAVVQVCMLHPLAPFNIHHVAQSQVWSSCGSGRFWRTASEPDQRSQTFAQELNQATFLIFHRFGLILLETSPARACQIKIVVKLENRFNAGFRWGEATLAPALLHGFLTGSTRWVCRVTAKLLGGCLVFLMFRRWDGQTEWKWEFFAHKFRWGGEQCRLPGAFTACAHLHQQAGATQVLGSIKTYVGSMLDVTSQGLFTASSRVVHVWVQCGPGTLQKGNCVKSCCMRCPQKAFNLLRHQCQQCVKWSETDWNRWTGGALWNLRALLCTVQKYPLAKQKRKVLWT